MADDDARWPVFLRRGHEPIFILNRRRQIVFVNQAWEALTGVSADAARGLPCTRRSSGHELAHLGRTLVPPKEALEGSSVRARRARPGTAIGPPWWDIDFFPVVGERGVSVVICRIRRPAAPPIQSNTAMPAAWAELRSKVQGAFSFARLESVSLVMRLAVAQSRMAAETGCHASLIGAPGTGKYTLARTIHAHSQRRELPFVAVDCVRLPADAIRGVLFGPRGIERADWAGMVYLNEPSRLPLDLQAELASKLKSAPPILAGFAGDPRELLANGTLHPELFGIVGVLVIQLPTLQERKEDIAGLVEVLLRQAAASLGREPRTISANALAALHEHSWPGNLDEMTSVLFTALWSRETTAIDAAELPMAIRHGAASTIKRKPVPQLDQTLAQVERRLIKLALARAKGNKSKAADLLGVWRPRLLRRMETLGMTRPEADA